MAWFYNLSIKYKISLIVLTSILGFAAYLSYNYVVGLTNETRLNRIQNIEFPTLHNIYKSIDLLVQVRGVYLEALNEDDVDMLEEIHEPVNAFNQEMSHISKRLPEFRADVEIIKLSFTSYTELANNIVFKLIDSTLSSEHKLTTIPQLNKKYKEIHIKLVSFKNKINRSFISSLTNARFNKKNLYG